MTARKDQSGKKVLAICGSPRLNGNTQTLLETACSILNSRGIKTELILLANHNIKPCIGCARCKELKDKTCAIKDDDFHLILQKMLEADGIIVGSPVYFGSATSQTTSLLHRAGYVSRNNGHIFKGKIGAPVVVGRRAGHNFTYAQLLFFFIVNNMIVPGSTYWNIAFGRQKGDVNGDEEGMETIRNFAVNMANLLNFVPGQL
ncbi:MAG: flavodoxin family protein [Spirochaetota bacterium]